MNEEKLEKNSSPRRGLSDLDYLKLNKWQRFWYKVGRFFVGIPGWFVRLFKKIGNAFKRFGLWIAEQCKDIFNTFKNGSWKTRVSFFFMGFGNFAAGQVLRGLMFALMQWGFVFYMIFSGAHWLGKFGTLGTVEAGTAEVLDPVTGELITTWIEGDNSFKILLYGLMTIFFILALVYTWRLNVKQCRIIDEINANGKKVHTNKEDLRSLIDDQFHKTLLSLPIFGIVMFTILPIIFMILVAFTNYDFGHDGYSNLFTWVGLENFNSMLTFGSGLSVAFGEILAWTLIWAFFATFSNYFLGMFVAMMINKKGIKIKKVWRTILVMTIAIPQFISLLYVSNLFADNGIVNATLQNWGFIDLLHRWGWLDANMSYIPFWSNGTFAKVMVLLINIWVGIPYLMLITTGILMNIPEDLYESSRIDGANAFQQFTKITLPYMLFVTGPYLLTSFVGNINNFNVIYLLTQGGPRNPAWGDAGGYIAGDTTILITWLFGITTGSEANYKMASVIGILIFIVVSVLSLIVFSVMPSTKREDDFS
ncbi:MAG: sugar ABC transporter permease [Clostridiales bacterium]|nr:sugar ABC transporter permease [Clostridiales bacterium]